VTVSIAGQGFNTVGSYVLGFVQLGVNVAASSGSTYAAGSGTNQVISTSIQGGSTNNLSGTWRWMCANVPGINSCGQGSQMQGIFCRVS
jgi:hypothetical protein